MCARSLDDYQRFMVGFHFLAVGACSRQFALQSATTIAEPEKAESDGGTSDSEGSESASDSEQNDPCSSLSFSLQKCVDHLDRVLAGCCWEVHATRVTPPESLPSRRF